MKELPVRSIISDTGTATYKTTKYLKTLLTPLTKSQYNILNTDDFILIKSEKNTWMTQNNFVWCQCAARSNDRIILSKLYQEKKIKISIPKKILRELSYVCTKEVPFMFNDEIYIQSVVVAMYSPIESLLANILWRHYKKKSYQRVIGRDVLMTHTLMLIPKKFDFIFTKLNSFQPNIKFTLELKMNKQITFLDILVQRTTADQIETCVHRNKNKH